MRRGLVTATAVLALGVGVTAADATIGKGKFAGKTSAKDPLGFSVDKRGRVYSFWFQGVTLTCTDGDSFETPSREHPDSDGATEIRTTKSERFSVDSKGRWGFTARNREQGNGYDVSGRFTSQNRSRGTFSVFANFDPAPANTPNPDGSVHCTSGKLKFVVKRRG